MCALSFRIKQIFFYPRRAVCSGTLYESLNSKASGSWLARYGCVSKIKARDRCAIDTGRTAPNLSCPRVIAMESVRSQLPPCKHHATLSVWLKIAGTTPNSYHSLARDRSTSQWRSSNRFFYIATTRGNSYEFAHSNLFCVTTTVIATHLKWNQWRDFPIFRTRINTRFVAPDRVLY